MMKLVISLLLLGALLVWGSPVDQKFKDYKTVDKDFLVKQQKILKLYKQTSQKSLDEELKIFNDLTSPMKWLEERKGSFEKPEMVDTVIELFKYDRLLPKDQPFTYQTQEHLDLAINIFELFYYAKDFDTFFEAAMLMRRFLNEGLFLYSVSVAVIHRKDMYGIIIPPVHEIVPWMFYDAKVIHEAYQIKMLQGSEKMMNKKEYYIRANTTRDNMNMGPRWEPTLTYFREDISMNNLITHYTVYYPTWMDGEEFGIKNDYRGELYLELLQAILARYTLERYSNHLGEVPDFDWDYLYTTPFYPSLEYPNGEPFPQRPEFVDLRKYLDTYRENSETRYGMSLDMVKDFERKIRDIIRFGVVYNTKEKKFMDLYKPEEHRTSVNMFGNLLQSNEDSYCRKCLGDFMQYATHLLGHSMAPNSWQKLVPSALEHSTTAARDPAYYQLLKKLFTYVIMFQEMRMKPYEKKDLMFPGVEIEKIEMDRLVTYFDEFYGDISNAVMKTEEQRKMDSVNIWAIQERLNHKPFTYKMHVKSNEEKDAMIRIFLGPKYETPMPMRNLSTNRFNFVPIDMFKMHLTPGMNIIKRSSQESAYYTQDRRTFRELEMQVTKALTGQGEFHVTGEENYISLPHRMMLPKGTGSGLPFQFYFMISPYEPYKGQREEMTYLYPRPGTGGGFMDNRSMYYPLDRPIKFEKMFMEEIPNSYMYETKIYHRTAEEAQMPITQHMPMTH